MYLKASITNDYSSSNGIPNCQPVISFEANEYVGCLLLAGNVFRIFDAPFANANVSPGHKFSVRGFFMHYIEQKYQFFFPTTIAKQYWTVSPEVSYRFYIRNSNFPFYMFHSGRGNMTENIIDSRLFTVIKLNIFSLKALINSAKRILTYSKYPHGAFEILRAQCPSLVLFFVMKVDQVHLKVHLFFLHWFSNFGQSKYQTC